MAPVHPSPGLGAHTSLPTVTSSFIWQLSHTMMKVCSAFSRFVGRNKTWRRKGLPYDLLPPCRHTPPPLVPLLTSHPAPPTLLPPPAFSLRLGGSAKAPAQTNAGSMLKGMKKKFTETEIQTALHHGNTRLTSFVIQEMPMETTQEKFSPFILARSRKPAIRKAMTR